MFVAEAPGRLGAEVTMIPLHGDKTGDNFELLLQTSGLSRADVFVTNAVLCNPQDDEGNNRPPRRDEIENCTSWLSKQIEVVNPKIVVSLGAVALRSLDLIASHGLQLSESVRTAHDWNNRILIPLYHHGQRAMLHRSMINQRADYYFVAERFRRASTSCRPSRSKARDLPMRGKEAVRQIVARMGEVSLFQLHKLLYLLDYYHQRAFGTKATEFHYIRQKDGPYCVDIAGQVGKTIEGIQVKKTARGIVFTSGGGGLFAEPIGTSEFPFLETVLDKYGRLTAAELKTSVYLTRPMKELLRLERSGATMLNAPLLLAH